MKKLRVKKSAIDLYLKKGGSLLTFAAILGVTDIRTIRAYVDTLNIVLTCESILEEIQNVLNCSRLEILEEKYPEPLKIGRKSKEFKNQSSKN